MKMILLLIIGFFGWSADLPKEVTGLDQSPKACRANLDCDNASYCNEAGVCEKIVPKRALAAEPKRATADWSMVDDRMID